MPVSIAPHGGVLKDLIARDAAIANELNNEARDLNDIFLTEVSRKTCTLVWSLTHNSLSANYVTLNSSWAAGSPLSRDS